MSESESDEYRSDAGTGSDEDRVLLKPPISSKEEEPRNVSSLKAINEESFNVTQEVYPKYMKVVLAPLAAVPRAAPNGRNSKCAKKNPICRFS